MPEQRVIPDQTAPEEKSDLCCHYLFILSLSSKHLIMPEEIVLTQIRPLLKEQSGQFVHCLLGQGKVGKIRCVKGRLEVANSVNPDQTSLKDNLICVYNICHLNTTF